MERYIGTKLINASPMTRGDYNLLRGWPLPEDENGSDEGYLVEYVDGGFPNTSLFSGYVSWSPKSVFDKAYRKTYGLTFGHALEALLIGLKVTRAGWNGKGMWLAYVPACSYEVANGLLDNSANYAANYALRPWIGIKTVDDQFMPWLASQSDMLALDWAII